MDRPPEPPLEPRLAELLAAEAIQLEYEAKLPIEDVLRTYCGVTLAEWMGKKEPKRLTLDDAVKEATAVQPTGLTRMTMVFTKVPHILRGSLREYQHVGLEWLAAMYERKLNGILADEMGLGKTITVISFLAHLACTKDIWGPHLIVVPASVLRNWEAEFKRWCPDFNIIIYFGTHKERQQKRQGWNQPNSFHICITSIVVAIEDAAAFRRKKWHYIILDEAHQISNFRSKRWHTLLSWDAEVRLLLSGLPLPNSQTQLLSLLQFLLPNVDLPPDLAECCSKLSDQLEDDQDINRDNGNGNLELIDRLRTLLHPFVLRRLKVQVIESFG